MSECWRQRLEYRSRSALSELPARLFSPLVLATVTEQTPKQSKQRPQQPNRPACRAAPQSSGAIARFPEPAAGGRIEVTVFFIFVPIYRLLKHAFAYHSDSVRYRTLAGFSVRRPRGADVPTGLDGYEVQS